MELQATLQEALSLHKQQELDKAKVLYQSILDQDVSYFDALHLLGVLFGQQGDYEQAVSYIQQALQLNPNHISVYYNLGVALQALERFEEAVVAYDKVIAAQPKHWDAFYNRSIALEKLKRLDEALISYNQLEALNNQEPRTYVGRGNTRILLQQYTAALTDFNQAIDLDKNCAEAYSSRGFAWHLQDKFDLAIQDYQRAITLKPNFAEAYYNRANTFKAMRRLDEALQDYDRAIALKAGYVDAYNNRGNTLTEMNRHEEAVESFDKAIAAKTVYAEVYANRGTALQSLKRIEDAIASYEQAIALKPNYPEAILNKGLALLLGGDFKQGWPLYEARWQTDMLKTTKHHFTQPQWLGNDEDIQGKRIFVHHEQGMGDTLQFCRYIPLIAQRGATVIVEVPKPLVRVMASLEGVSEVVAKGSGVLPSFDYHCPMVSLPLAFKTFSIEDIPTHIPYLFADMEATMAWKRQLGGWTRPRVGLVWNGGFRVNQPKLWTVNERRNIPFQKMAILQDLPCDFYSLQKGEPAESEIKAIRPEIWGNDNFHIFTESIHDFADTAALLMNLDLIIAVDTSTPHLAAALGKPVWLLNRFDLCWRWLVGRADTPWYPSMRLYHQEKAGDWDSVLLNVKQDLAHWIATWKSI